MWGKIGHRLEFGGPVLRDDESGLAVALIGDPPSPDPVASIRLLRSLYERHGTGFPAQLRGSFALALHDPASGSWVLARDQAGSVPLYWARDREGAVVFGDSILELLPHLWQVRLNRKAVVDFLTHLWSLDGKTFVEGVELVPSGTVVTPDGATSYFVFRHVPEDRADADWRAEVMETLRSSVESALGPDLACHLSGGIDSSVIAVLASRLAGVPPASYVSAFPEYPAYDESPFGRVVAGLIGAPLTEVPVLTADFPATLPELILAAEEPKCHPPVFARYQLEVAAHGDGRRTLLTGRGADELFTGYDAHVQASLLNHRARRTAMPESQRCALLRPEFFDGLDYDVEAAYDAVYARCPGDSPLERILALDYSTLMANWMVLDYKISRRFGIRCRAPFLDRSMVDLALRIPIGMKRANDTPKALLREAVRGTIPDVLIDRPKVGFRTPMGEMMRDGLESYVRDAFADPSGAFWQHFDPRSVRALIDRHFSAGQNLGWQIWALLSIKTWCRIFLDEQRWRQ